ncbi:MAG: hypothetical protein CMJ31_07450 [Phycisphaerae bacterium]|nr:hypothetical protein [Phycisphaerae bacterium]
MRESDLLRHIYTRSDDLAAAFGDVLVGPGDDAAVVRTSSGDRLVITVDQLVEGRHYDPATDLDLVARKAIARSVSDIAAMGAIPAFGLATGLIPRGYADADDLFDAMAKWARHWNCPLIGGDIAFAGEGQPLSMTTTVIGKLDPAANPTLRSNARPGDELWLTGQVGGSFASGWHLRFDPRLAAGLEASKLPRAAAIDLSDGLGRDAARVAVASNVILEIEAAKLPISHRAKSWRDACADGEDYELLLALPPRPPEAKAPPINTAPTLIGPVGQVRALHPGESPTATITDPHGSTHDAQSLGWDHE